MSNLQTFDLPIRGMTCASCAGRVERALSRVPEVQQSSVNLATEQARITAPRERLDELLEASLDEEREEQIRSLICSVPGIRECHGLRTRKIGCATAVEAHVMVDRSLSLVEAHDMATRAEQTLEEGIRGQLFVNLHVEPLPEPGRPHREGRLSLEPEDDVGGDAP